MSEIEPVIILAVMVAVGLVIAWAVNAMASKSGRNANNLRPNRGLPEPKTYPPMPKVQAPKSTAPSSREVIRQPAPISSRISSGSRVDDGYRYTPPTEDIAVSMLVAQATDNAMLGYVAGGSVTGALLGAALNNHNEPTPAYREPDPEPSYVAPSKSYDYSSRDDDTSSRSSSSSYDFGSSSSSWSSSSDSSSWSSSDSGSSD